MNHAPMVTLWVNGVSCRVKAGLKISEALQACAAEAREGKEATPSQEKSWELALPCGGGGRCGKCKVKAAGVLSAPDAAEREKLTEQELQEGIRLGCRARILGDCRIWLPERDGAVVLQEGKVLNGSDRTKIEDPLFEQWGICVDIGTTTIAARLYDRAGLRAQEGMENPQRSFGADVISRIEKSMAGQQKALAGAVREGITVLTGRLCAQAEIEPEWVDTLVITGNTAMLYLLCERHTDALSRAPFAADWLADEWKTARELGLPCPSARVYLPPCIGAFVGADITTAMLAAGLCRDEKTRLLVDIGTNGEVALWKDGRLTCCSTAAGPAFEGTGLSRGMPGGPGAISHVRQKDGKLEAEVIGQKTPAGICGSGIVDAIRCLLDQEIIDETGYMEEETAVIAGDVCVTQQDVRMVQLAKSAICAGITTLLHENGIGAESLEELLIAGGFGSYLNLANAVGIGLIPPLSLEKMTVCGNAALEGAALLLKDRNLVEQGRALAKKAQTVELAANPFFQDTYIEGMMFA